MSLSGRTTTQSIIYIYNIIYILEKVINEMKMRDF